MLRRLPTLRADAGDGRVRVIWQLLAPGSTFFELLLRSVDEGRLTVRLPCSTLPVCISRFSILPPGHADYGHVACWCDLLTIALVAMKALVQRWLSNKTQEGGGHFSPFFESRLRVEQPSSPASSPAIHSVYFSAFRSLRVQG